MKSLLMLMASAGILWTSAAVAQTNQDEVFYFSGTINNKYRIFMFFQYDGMIVKGQYFYESTGTYIPLFGSREGGWLVIIEGTDADRTGKFDGTFERGVFRGTWTNADGSRSFPFELVETSAPIGDWSFDLSASKDDGKYECTLKLDLADGRVSQLQLEVSAAYAYAPHACYLGMEGMAQAYGSSYLELYFPDEPGCRIQLTDAGNCFVLRFRGSCRQRCGANAWFEDLIVYKYDGKMKAPGFSY